MKTIRSLKSAIKASGRTIEIDELPPHEMDNCGSISIYLDTIHKEEFIATDGCCCVGTYFSDAKGSRGEAIESLIKDIESGFSNMSEQTAHECGVTL